MRPQSRSYREFRFAAHHAGQNQVGDVRTRDDEDEKRCGKQHDQDRASVRRQLFPQRNQPYGECPLWRIRFRMILSNRMVRAENFLPRRLDRCLRRQPRKHLGHSVLTALHHSRGQVVSTRNHVCDHLGVRRIGYRWFQDTHDGSGTAAKGRIEPHGLADNTGVPIEAVGPKSVSQDRRSCRGRAVVVGIKKSAKHGA